MNLGIGSFGVYDPILPGNLLPVSLTVDLLLLLVIFQLTLEILLQRPHLAILCRILGAILQTLGRISLQKFDLILDTSVQNLRLSNEVFELGRGRVVRTTEDALMNGTNFGDIGSELANFRSGVLDSAQEIVIGEHGCAFVDHSSRTSSNVVVSWLYGSALVNDSCNRSHDNILGLRV